MEQTGEGKRQLIDARYDGEKSVVDAHATQVGVAQSGLTRVRLASLGDRLTLRKAPRDEDPKPKDEAEGWVDKD